MWETSQDQEYLREYRHEPIQLLSSFWLLWFYEAGNFPNLGQKDFQASDELNQCFIATGRMNIFFSKVSV